MNAKVLDLQTFGIQEFRINYFLNTIVLHVYRVIRLIAWDELDMETSSS